MKQDALIYKTKPDAGGNVLRVWGSYDGRIWLDLSTGETDGKSVCGFAPDVVINNQDFLHTFTDKEQQQVFIAATRFTQAIGGVI